MWKVLEASPADFPEQVSYSLNLPAHFRASGELKRQNSLLLWLLNPSLFKSQKQRCFVVIFAINYNYSYIQKQFLLSILILFCWRCAYRFPPLISAKEATINCSIMKY